MVSADLSKASPSDKCRQLIDKLPCSLRRKRRQHISPNKLHRLLLIRIWIPPFQHILKLWNRRHSHNRLLVRERINTSFTTICAKSTTSEPTKGHTGWRDLAHYVVDGCRAVRKGVDDLVSFLEVFGEDVQSQRIGGDFASEGLGVVNVLGFDDGEDGAEDFGLNEGVVEFDVGDDGGFDKAGGGVEFAAEDDFALCGGEEGLHAGELGGVDDLAD